MRMRRAMAAAVTALSLTAAAGWCVAATVPSAEPTKATTPGARDPGMLIPRATLFGNPDRAGSALSPDGKQIAYLSAVDGVLNVWVAPVDDLSKARAVTQDARRGIRQFEWAYTNSHIIYLQDQGGDENWRIYAVDLDGGEARDLTPMPGVAARIAELSPAFPDEILVGVNDRSPQFHDVHRVNIMTGERSVVYKNDSHMETVTDEDFKVRLGSRFTPDGGIAWETLADDGTATPFEQVGMEDTMTTGPVGFDKGGRAAYFQDSRGRDTGALFRRDLTTGETTLLAEDPRADAGAMMTHPTEHRVQAVAFNYDRTKWKVLDPSIKADLDHLATVAAGEVNVTSRSLDDARWLVAYVMDDGPTRVYLYDRAGATPGAPGKATFLYTNRKSLEGLPLAKMHPVTVRSRDGLDLVSYLTLPKASDPDADGRPDAAVPMVLLVHGGPWARDVWGFNSYHQWLANRGYAVLSVNFRGSTGLGKKFINAGNREWGAKMHDDLLDAVDWAVAEGIADRSKVAIMGGSYGGYAALAGLTMTPDVFACGVSIVGPSNITTLLNTIPSYWKPGMEMFKNRVGDHSTDEGREFLKSRSPLTFADRITKPLLIGQGANDPRVKQSESDQIVAAMTKHGIPVAYVLFPDEGHGFARPANATAFNAVTEQFFARHLGGRAEPIGGDVAASTAQVLEGADGIPGLPEALAARSEGGGK